MSDYARFSLTPIPKLKNSNLYSSGLDNDIEHEEDILDPTNETKEVASQLALIRKKHDKTRESNYKKRIYCEKLKIELEKMNSTASMIDLDAKTISSKIDQLSVILEQNKKKHEDEMLCKKSYLYMLDRMKKEKIAMELKANALQTSLKSTKHVLDSETDKFRKIRESQYQSRVMLQEIKETLAYDQRRKNERIQQLERNLKQRQELAFRREERQKRQAEISEDAANEDKDSQESRTRDVILLNRMWYIALCKKFEAEVKKNVQIEQAYNKIRTETGIADMNDIVERFLTREQSYSSLLHAVSEAESKLEGLKKQNEAARSMLQETQYEEGLSTRKIYAEIDESEQKLCEYYKEFAVARDRMQKSISTYNSIISWGNKICHTLDVDCNLDIATGGKINESKNTVEEMFDIINKKLEEVISPLSQEIEETRKVLDGFNKKKTQDIVSEIAAVEGNTKKIERRYLTDSENDGKNLTKAHDAHRDEKDS